MKKETFDFTKQNAELLKQLNNNVDSLDHADAQEMPAPNIIVRPVLGVNPPFKSTFNLQFKTYYFTLNSGTYTNIAASALNAALKNNLPFFVFGLNDLHSGFKKIKGQFPIDSNWVYGRAGIYGFSDFNEFAFDANVTSLLQTGDLIIPFTSPLPGTGTTTLALNIVRCPEIGFGSLMASLASDLFRINGIRYTLADTAQVDQFTNQLLFQNLSIFGQFGSDSITPNDFKKPEQFQNGIIDVPISGSYGKIDKYKGIGFYNLYTNVAQSWTIFCPEVHKLT